MHTTHLTAGLEHSSPKPPYQVELLGASHGVPRADAMPSWSVVASTIITTYTQIRIADYRIAAHVRDGS